MTLACDNLTLQAGARVLCRELSFAIVPGEVWGVLGPNGAGKTTLLHALAGLVLPARGRVMLDHVPIATVHAAARARQIGILTQQEENDFWGSALDYVLLGRFPHAASWLGWQREDEDAARAQLDAVGLTALAGQRYTTLSGGERQRVRFAQLLAQAPRYLLLDEPLQHLDLRYQIALLQRMTVLAQQEGRAIVLVLHDALWPVRVCTHALLLDGRGGAQKGTARELLTRANLETLFGCSLDTAGAHSGAGFVPAL
jgi:iron complex transport system ATP-binding protein